MEQSPCARIDNDHLQMVIFRDPRAVATSTYFYTGRHGIHHYEESVDAYVLRMLPALTQWVAVRFILFEGLMPGRSTLFFYEDAMADPLGWHYQWLSALGLQLPADVVKRMTDAAVNRDFDFYTKGFDEHLAGRETAGCQDDTTETTSVARTYQTELQSETLPMLESILRTWLPPTLAVRFGVSLI